MKKRIILVVACFLGLVFIPAFIGLMGHLFGFYDQGNYKVSMTFYEYLWISGLLIILITLLAFIIIYGVSRYILKGSPFD